MAWTGDSRRGFFRYGEDFDHVEVRDDPRDQRDEEICCSSW
jgi:hypothetical protein